MSDVKERREGRDKEGKVIQEWEVKKMKEGKERERRKSRKEMYREGGTVKGNEGRREGKIKEGK